MRRGSLYCLGCALLREGAPGKLQGADVLRNPGRSDFVFVSGSLGASKCSCSLSADIYGFLSNMSQNKTMKYHSYLFMRCVSGVPLSLTLKFRRSFSFAG